MTPAKGGALINLGANYPHTREDLEPLDKEDSEKIRNWITARLSKSGYKAKALPFVYNGDTDYNDFRIQVLLKESEVDQDKYQEIKRIWSERRNKPEETPEPRTLREAFE